MDDLPTLVLETPRLILRRLTLDDLDALAELYRDPDVRRYFPEGMLTREETNEELEWIIDVYYARYGYGLWATVLRETGAFIGRCGLLPWKVLVRAEGMVRLDGADEYPEGDSDVEVEVAYLLAKDQWGRGLATEAARAIVEYAFATLHLSRVICLFEPENIASANVGRKIGMRPDGTVELDDEVMPLFALTAERAREGSEGAGRSGRDLGLHQR
jgi:ribosomal-protein-alanine N-acetyltransferase